MPGNKKPNILVIWGDDIGIWNLSCYSHGTMGYRTPNIDRLAKEGMMFTDSYGEQSCTAGRASFITGQSVFRTGLSKVGFPGADVGLQAEDATIAELLEPRGYTTDRFGKNHLGDLNKFLPTGRIPTTRRMSASDRSSCRAVYCAAGRPTRTIRPSNRAGAALASRRSKTPVP